jgi:hypothetical protein
MSWASIGLSVKTRAEVKGVLYCTVGGFLTMESTLSLIARLATAMAREKARGAVVDLRAATPLMREAEWRAVPTGVLEVPELSVPVAVLVKPEDRHSAGHHAMRMAQLGYMRGVFTLEAEAREWAQHWATYLRPRLRESLARSTQPASPQGVP